MVVGVSKGYEVKLELVGVGYRAEVVARTMYSTSYWDTRTIHIFNFLLK
jgi:ribosomal protein L6P/L9E